MNDQNVVDERSGEVGSNDSVMYSEISEDQLVYQCISIIYEDRLELLNLPGLA